MSGWENLRPNNGLSWYGVVIRGVATPADALVWRPGEAMAAFRAWEKS